MSAHAEQVAEVRRTLVDPVRVCERLGLAKGAVRQASGLSIRCPVHAEQTPSCSVTRGPDGTIRAKCFGCSWTGDVLSLVAAARGLDLRRDFRDVLATAAEMWGMTELLAELAGATPAGPRELPDLPEPEPSRDYPPHAEVEAVWANAVAVDRIEPCQVALALRALFPGPDLARAVTGSALPRWARYAGHSWADSGHRIIVPTFDAQGAMRSLRAWHVDRDTKGPKRLPPAGHRATGLVLANPRALDLLRAPSAPTRLIIAEGEPDFLSLCQAYPAATVLGVVNGSWTQAFADRIPFGSLVVIRTHHDEAGDRYAAAIAQTLAGRALIKRGVQ